MTTEEKFAKFFDEVWPARAAKLKPSLRMTAVEEFIASGGCEVCPTVATDGPMRYDSVWSEIWDVEAAGRQGR